MGDSKGPSETEARAAAGEIAMTLPGKP